MTEDNTNTLVLLIPLMLVITLAAAIPAYFVWMVAPPVAGEFFLYVRIAAAGLSAIAGAFLGAYIIKMAVSIANDLTPAQTDEN